MTRKREISFPFFHDDYLGSSRVTQMSLAQEGAYLRLLINHWKEGSIPADITSIARICRVSKATMAKLWPGVSPCFEPMAENPARLVNEPAVRKRESLEAYRAKRSTSGKEGAETKWRGRRKGRKRDDTKGGKSDDNTGGIGDGNSVASGMANGMAKGMANGCLPDLSPPTFGGGSARAQALAREAPTPTTSGEGRRTRTEPQPATDGDFGAAGDPKAESCRRIAELWRAAFPPGLLRDEVGHVQRYVAKAFAAGQVSQAVGGAAAFLADPFWRSKACPPDKLAENAGEWLRKAAAARAEAAPQASPGGPTPHDRCHDDGCQHFRHEHGAEGCIYVAGDRTCGCRRFREQADAVACATPGCREPSWLHEEETGRCLVRGCKCTRWTPTTQPVGVA